MNKKSIKLLLITMMLLTTLTGCSIPFLNKDKGTESAPTEETPNIITDMSTYVTVSDSVDFTVGDTVIINDVVTVSDEVSANLMNLVFLDSAGSVTNTLDTSTVGTYTYDIVVEFNDGSGWSGSYTYNVNEPEVFIPDVLYNNINNGNWSTDVLTSAVADNEGIRYDMTGNLISYNNNVINVNNDVKLNGTSPEVYDLSRDIWTWCILTNDNELVMAENMSSPLRDSLSIQSFETYAKSLEQLVTENDTPDNRYASTIFRWYVDLWREMITVSTEVTDYVIYDADGNSYPIKAVVEHMDYSILSGPMFDNTYMFYVDLDENTKLILYYLYDCDFNYEESSNYSFMTAELNNSNMPKLNSYEEFKEYFIAECSKLEYNPTMFNAALASYCEKNHMQESLSMLADNVILGDYSVFVEEVVEEQPVIEDVETPVEDAVEQDSDDNIVSSIPSTYEQQHPEIYTWPSKDTKYRRWYYVIDDPNSYVGSIIYPNGTIYTGNGDLNTSTGTSNNSSSTSTGVTANNYQSYVLTSNNANYNLTNENFAGLTFLPENSTSGRLCVSYDNELYYIEIVRASQIDNYKTNCIYPISSMKDAKYSVELVDTASAELGSISLYNVTYLNMSDVTERRPYMCVYTTSSDYIVCYGNNLIKENSTVLHDILTKCIVTN